MSNTTERAFPGVVPALALLLIAATLPGVAHGGSLSPPGPVAPTGKSVILSLPFTISQPGSYVLIGNLTAPAVEQDGITVNANNVTIDLQGFELVGPTALFGNAIVGNGLNLKVLNGTIRHWSGTGILMNGSGLAVDGMILKDTYYGIFADAATEGATVTNCRAEGSAYSGITLSHRSIVSKCLAINNTLYGVSVGADSVITDTVARNNNIQFSGGTHTVLENCVAEGNNSTNGVGITVGTNSIVRGCTVRNNFGDEIVAGNRSLIESCIADGNSTAGSGIVVASHTTVRGCTSMSNGNRGIHATGDFNRLEGNLVAQNSSGGIKVDGSVNVGIMNTAIQNLPSPATSNYQINLGGANQFPTISTTTTTTGSWANLSD